MWKKKATRFPLEISSLYTNCFHPPPPPPQRVMETLEVSKLQEKHWCKYNKNGTHKT